MSNQINMDVAAVIAALNKKYDADQGQQTYETSTEAKSAAQAAIMAAEAAQMTANAATKVADAAVDLIDVSLPLKYDKSGGTITGNAVVDGNLTVTGTINATISGTTSDAVRATKDSNNNVIVDTYATKSELNEAKAYTDTAIANLVDSAPSTLNTIGELAEAFQENDELIDALNTTVANKANSSEVVKLSGNQTISGTKKFNSAIDGSILGNAATATKLTATKAITLTGGATGSTNFDGNSDVTISVTSLDVSKASAGTLPVARGGTGSSTKNFVDLSSNQTIAGTKTFSSSIQSHGVHNLTDITKGVVPTSTKYLAYHFCDTTGNAGTANRLATIEYSLQPSGDAQVIIGPYKFSDLDAYNGNLLSIGIKADGTTFTSAKNLTAEGNLNVTNRIVFSNGAQLWVG